MLTHAFQKEGVVLRECCDFERDFATQPSSSSSSSLGKTSSSAQTSSRTSAMLEMVIFRARALLFGNTIFAPSQERTKMSSYHLILALLRFEIFYYLTACTACYDFQ